MKQLLSINLIALMALIMSCGISENDKKEAIRTNQREIESRQDIIRQHSKDSIYAVCLKIGHVYEEIKNGLLKETIYISSNEYMTARDEWESTSLKLIDTPDSSYFVREVKSDYKHCYRCGTDVEFKNKSKYIKTIWKK